MSNNAHCYLTMGLFMHRSIIVIIAFLAGSPLNAAEGVRLLTNPEVSPDGSTLLFVHRSDIWRVDSKGGAAQRVTFHSAVDQEPHFSPDGKQIAFISDRTGSRQVFVLDENDSEPRQVTWHTEGHSLLGWFPDGRHVLVGATRDHFWKYAGRLFKVDTENRSAEQLLFNGTGSQGQVSPDGTQLLFVRDGERWWRKGYHGARAGQIWLFDLNDRKFSQTVKVPEDCFSPVWKPDGSGFCYCTSHGANNGARNLWEYSLKTKKSRQLTQFKDDLVTEPVMSADGRTIVFSHLFDLYRLQPGKNAKPRRITITVPQEDLAADIHRRTLTEATDAAFTKDGLEIAFIAGGDLWVMETELREPVRITSTAEFETDPVFIDNDQALICISWNNGDPDIVRIERSDKSKYWWQNREFTQSRITEDAAVESNLQLSPDGGKLAYVRERGDLWIRDLASGKSNRLVESFSVSSFDFSPDGNWITYALTNDNFNTDIWIVPVDGSAQAVNISRHPDDETGPLWSSDGKLIAFTGRRADDEVDIFYVWLTEEDNDTDSRDRKLKKSLEAFEKARSKKSKQKTAAADDKSTNAPKSENGAAKPDAQTPENQPDKNNGNKADESEEDNSTGLPDVKIDFADIHRRIRKISVPDSTERLLGWSPDGKKLIFSAAIKGEAGTYSVEFPEKLTPKKISTDTGSIKGWLKSPDRILWLKKGVPAAQPMSGSGTDYAISAHQDFSQSQRFRTAFEASWRVMRDWWYDDNFGNHNWDQIRRKYVDAAEAAMDTESLTRVIHLMLGELNGSHLGFSSGTAQERSTANQSEWQPVTVHPGVRFDLRFKGPGLKIKDVIPKGPATDEASTLRAGEIILAIDGTAVDSAMDLSTVLNGRLDRTLRLRVKAQGRKATERDVVLRPTTYAQVRSLLYEKWQDDNRSLVSRRAQNIGYLHIQGMNWPSFLDFERELYDVGYGKDGLIIDVRDNGGGFTTDHLLTALTQPRHAFTVPRGGGPGYPQSRMVYASWDKPIVVLCNQNSYSNAEIFSHAIKGLGRGKLVGVPTAGGVISTGLVRIMDVGRLRLPFRGWFVKETGNDMELNGAVPHFIVRPRPAEIPNGKDRQLNKAIQVLQHSIKEWKAAKQPDLIKATEAIR